MSDGLPYTNNCGDSSDESTDIRETALLGMSGTSMATPACAGASALVRQYFEEGRCGVLDLTRIGFNPWSFRYPRDSIPGKPASGFSPSAALMRAVLANGAEAISGDDGIRSLQPPPSVDQVFQLKIGNKKNTHQMAP